MSIEAVNQFLTEVSESKELQAEVTTVKETEMEAENYWQAFTEIAAKHGYEFTPDELASQIEQAFEASNAENLNEAELELIAGGLGQALKFAFTRRDYALGAVAGVVAVITSLAATTGNSKP